MACTLGWAVGGVLLSELGAGALTGILQWLVLRQQMRRAGWWIAATIAGWLTGWALVAFAVPPGASFLAGATVGSVTGLAQWLVLRRHMYRAGWWILVSALGWTLGLTELMGTLLVGAVAGAVTGIALELLLRYPSLRKN